MSSNLGRMDHFTIIKTITTGKSASLKLARDETTNQLVVLKIYVMGHLYMSDELSGYRRLSQTSPALSLFAFSRQSTMLTAQGNSEVSYMAIEYLPHGDLYSLLAKHKRFPSAIARRLIREILETVQAIHRLGFSHSALSLEHLYIDESLHIRVGSLAAVQNLNSSSRSADLFQCGVIFFQILVGRPPFWNNSSRDIFMRHLNSRNFNAFWKPFKVEEEHKEALQALLTDLLTQQVSVEEALNHEWMNLQVSSDSELLKYLM